MTDMRNEMLRPLYLSSGMAMKNFASRLQKHFLPTLCLFASTVLATGMVLLPSPAQAAASTRISSEISSSQLTPLPGSKHQLALAKYDSGRVSSSTKLEGISIYFSRTQSQENSVKALIAAQQNPSSPQYHQWLTPEQFAARFGMSDADISKVQNWLEQQGFQVDSVGRSKSMLRFSGTVGQVESAFATEIHNYSIPTATGVEKHFAPSTDLSIPAALAGVVQGIRNLDDFRPKSHLLANRRILAKPHFTGTDGSLFFAPGDVAAEYDINKAYQAGYTGVGQSITVVGQSEVALADIEAFQSAAGLPVKDPALVLVPNTGSPAYVSGDETESDLDLEWSGSIAKGANISLVYTGNSSNGGAFDSILYAIDNKIGTIISSSYGDCETDLQGSSTLTALESALEQATTQGQTVLSASGDDGATDCYANTDLTVSQQQSLAVDYPASSQYVTGVGGTEISQSNSAYLTAGDGYWSATGSADIITSVLQYIPEQGWNEDSPNCGVSDCLASGGGGASALFPKPTWQAGVPGIPADSKRDVPDVSLNASINYPGYLFCTSDTTDWAQGQVASCNSGFRDASTGDLTYAGGTSFATPIFAGMLAIINQQQNYTTGQGLVNPTLYTLASDSSTYASAFHDITSGNNDCPSGTDLCNSTVTGFAAGTGYDQVTGLGTIDLGNLVGAWPASTGVALIGTTTTLSASNTAPLINTNDVVTITVASDTGSTIPTGTVSISVDGGTPITGNTLTANGTVTYTASFTQAGTHVISATYSGDSTHASSTGSLTLTAAVNSSGSGTFSVTATNITVAQGSVGTSTITVTPAGGYTGTVVFSASTTSTAIENDTCLTLSNAVVSGTSPVTETLSIDTNAANCLATGTFRKGSYVRAAGIGSGLTGKSGPITAGAVMVGLLLAGFLGRYSRKLRVLAGVILLATLGMALSGCGGGNGNTVSNAPKGTYTLTLTSTDSSSTTVPSVTTQITLTID
jgi:subtilase family serine protease